MPGIQAVLEPTAVAVEPGGRVSCQVRVRNTTPAAVTIGLTVEGGVAGWAWASPSQMEVGAGDEGLGRLVLRPPRASGAPPGRVSFQVVMTDLGSRWSKGLEGVVDVEPYVELVAAVVPKVGRGRRSSDYTVTLENRGNSVAEATLEGVSDDRRLEVEVTPVEVELGPSSRSQVRLTARARRPFLGRKPRDLPVHLTVSGEAPVVWTPRFDSFLCHGSARWPPCCSR
ncbi:MAG TPA: hypothetical protein VK975_02950 [Acidimicrobiales bacterium]|nr:hypothetical protein [Acidimicrobiales bacterium]